MKKLSKLIEELKADPTVKRYLYLRSIIASNEEYMAIVKSDLSLNKAKISNFDGMDVINEYIEVEKMVKSDLDLISSIINTEININFLA